MSNSREAWVTPEVIVYGNVKEIALQYKSKSFGAGDDVIVNDQSILADRS